MVTLATCTSKGKQYRLFLHGKLVETVSHIQEPEEEPETYSGKLVDGEATVVQKETVEN